MNEINKLVDKVSKWMEGSGPHADIVITSRIRLARNLQGVSFPHLLKEQKLEQIISQVSGAVKTQAIAKTFGELLSLKLDELSSLEKQILVEKHLISPAFAENDRGRAVILNQDESVSIMINEEDHLRIQLLMPALQLHETWRMANALDDALEEALDFAFHESKGYLTACPTNVGTGLRASVMVHLPALVMTKQAGKILTALSQVGLAVRGFYGEGTEVAGDLFQISNQTTLGQTEEEIINNLSSVVKQLIDQEISAREVLRQEYSKQLEDKVLRSYGTLTHARIISSEEALGLLSQLRLGIDLKIIKEVDPRSLNELIVLIQPGVLQGKYGKAMSASERDVKRAEIIQEKLRN